MILIPDKCLIFHDKHMHGATRLISYSVLVNPEHSGTSKKIPSLTSLYPDKDEFINEPLPGFGIISNTDSYYLSGKIKVADPRGFAFYISYDNLDEIMRAGCISKGIIQNRCAWGFKHNIPRLMVEGTDEYEDSVRRNRISKSRVYMRDVNIGDLVELHNGMEGIYVGAWKAYKINGGRYSGQVDYISFKRYHIVKIVDSKGVHLGYYYQSNIKVSSIKEKNRCTEVDYQKELMHCVNTDSAPGFTSSNSDGMRVSIKYSCVIKGTFKNVYYLTQEKNVEVTLGCELIPASDYSTLHHNDYPTSVLMIAELSDGKLYHMMYHERKSKEWFCNIVSCINKDDGLVMYRTSLTLVNLNDVKSVQKYNVKINGKFIN